MARTVHSRALFLVYRVLCVKPPSMLCVKPTSMLCVKPPSTLCVKPPSTLCVKLPSTPCAKPCGRGNLVVTNSWLVYCGQIQERTETLGSGPVDPYLKTFLSNPDHRRLVWTESPQREQSSLFPPPFALFFNLWAVSSVNSKSVGSIILDGAVAPSEILSPSSRQLCLRCVQRKWEIRHFRPYFAKLQVARLLAQRF
ncbi:hypothetical protein TNCV_4653881 [Trichonephila clavipes]|nr:hypothetical protein TNCV_4653881 [Trichonephila clavipes]